MGVGTEKGSGLAELVAAANSAALLTVWREAAAVPKKYDKMSSPVG